VLRRSSGGSHASKPPPRAVARQRVIDNGLGRQRLGGVMAVLRRRGFTGAIELSVITAITVAATAPAAAQILLDPITVVATKVEETVTQALAGVSAVRGDTIDQLQPTRTEDIFFGVPGINFQQRPDDPGIAVNIRGMQDFGRVAVVVDGARQNFQRTGHNADGLVYIDPELIAGADVVRGPVANIYGSGAIGGVVSLRTKDVDDILKPGEKFGGELHGLIGSNQVSGLGSGFFAVRPSPFADAMVGAIGRSQSDYKDGNGNIVPNSHFNTTSEIGKFNLRPADGHEIKLSGLHLDTRYDSGIPVPAHNATVYATNVTNDIATGRWRYNRPDDHAFDFDVTTYWTKTRTEQTKTEGTNSAITGLLGSQRSFQIETIGVDAHNTSRFETGPFRNALTVGVDAFRDQVTVVDPTGTGDFFTPNGERTVSGAFAQLKASYSSWLEVIGAARYDHYELTGSTGGGSSGDRVSPKVTVGITPISWFTVYGTYAEGYRAPAVTEVFVNGAHPQPAPFILLQNLGLKPEIGKNKEVGINIRQDGLFVQNDALRIKANVFQNDISDFIEQTAVAPGAIAQGGTVCTGPFPFGCVQYQNVPSARIKGAELEAHYDAGTWFMSLAGSVQKGENLTANQPLLKIYPAQLATTVGARFLDRKVTAAVRWLAVAAKDADDIPPGNGLALPTDGFNVVNLYLDYRPNDDTVLAFGIDNLFNEYYVRYLDTRTLSVGGSTTQVPTPGAGITFKGSLKIRFGDEFFRRG
jgi:hemoglobin/transferrin/lactoferrin receptor protein